MHLLGGVALSLLDFHTATTAWITRLAERLARASRTTSFDGCKSEQYFEKV